MIVIAKEQGKALYMSYCVSDMYTDLIPIAGLNDLTEVLVSMSSSLTKTRDAKIFGRGELTQVINKINRYLPESEIAKMEAAKMEAAKKNVSQMKCKMVYDMMMEQNIKKCTKPYIPNTKKTTNTFLDIDV